MGQGRVVAKECSRLFGLYQKGKISRVDMDNRIALLNAAQNERSRLMCLCQDGEISRYEMDRQLKALNAAQSGLPFGAESSDDRENVVSARSSNTGSQAGCHLWER
ncbi:MAG: hypothetical protein ACLQF0_06805 [Dissulfurispiraceae bacterium]